MVEVKHDLSGVATVVWGVKMSAHRSKLSSNRECKKRVNCTFISKIFSSCRASIVELTLEMYHLSFGILNSFKGHSVKHL